MWLTAEDARAKFPGARIERGAWIESDAVIESDAAIGSGVVIKSGVVIESDAVIGSGAVIGRNRKGVKKAIAITTSSEYTLTGFLCDDGLIVTAGCMGNHAGLPPDDARKWIVENHGDKLALYDAFMVAVRAYLEPKKGE